MKIIIDETSIFQYDKKDVSVHIWNHKDGRFTGNVEYIGSIKFFDKRQAAQFAEMIDFILKK